MVLMYYSEAYLKGATLGSVHELEGEEQYYVAESIYDAIDNLNIENKKDKRWEDLERFSKLLRAGNDISNRIWVHSQSRGLDENKMMESAQEVQEILKKHITTNNGIIIPSGWRGHAIVLIIKPNGGNYDLTVVNTGDGVNYHHHDADTNGIYPLLSRVWVEFKNIDQDELFPKNAWFLQGLIALQWSKFVDNVESAIEKKEHSLAIYFYTSFLSNFTEFLVPVGDGKELYIPMQRSGSCAVASIMGALLYESENEATFHLYRNKIGNHLINNMLKDAAKNVEFIRVITDGFDANGRNFMKGLLSSMAHNVLQYLEVSLPKHFNHAGLIGSDRSSWLFEKKSSAINALKSNQEGLKLIAETIKTCNVIINFLDLYRVRPNSTQIKVSAAHINKLNIKNADLDNREMSLSMDMNRLGTGPNEFIQGSPDRPAFNITSFDDFKNAFEDVAKNYKSSSKILYIVSDIFKANERWPDLIKTADHNYLLGLQENVTKIVKIFVTKSTLTSFDDIVTLMLLEKLVWECTVLYNEKAEEKSKMCEPTFNLNSCYPKTMKNIISENNILGNNIFNWGFHNTFDPRNVKLFEDLTNEFLYKLDFEGPEEYFSSNSKNINFPSSQHKAIHNIQNHEKVKKMLEELKKAERNGKNSKHWTYMNPNKAQLIIAMDILRLEMIKIFPHVYNLMDALAIIHSAALGKRDTINGDYWIDLDEDSYIFNYYVDFKKSNMLPKGPVEIMNKSWDLIAPYKDECSKPASVKDIFYRFRHSEAFDDVVVTVTNYQSWLNYVKNAKTARIFDSVYFQYITDRLLNNPSNYFAGNIVYKPFDPILAKDIIDEMIKLIRISLHDLEEGKDQNLTMQKRKKLVHRAATISILVTRFIGQVDLYDVLHGNFCATRLAEIYKIMQPYSYLISKFKLMAVEVSHINFAMFYVCSIPIRNNLIFMENLVFTDCSAKMYRKTLEKFHWFISNISFITNGTLMGVIYDQFNYGIAGNPLKNEETGFMKYLLSRDFIPSKCTNHEEMTEFMFRSDGFVIEIHSSKPADKGKKYLMINLAKGTIVLDGNSLVATNIFINSTEFQKFFKAEDIPFASNGYAIEAGGKSIYVLSNFKGITYVLVHRNSFIANAPGIVTIHRKWNDKWYWSKSVDECSNFIESLNYKWTNGTKLFKRKDKSGSEEFLLFQDDKALEPLIKATIDNDTKNLKIFIKRMIGNWTIVDENHFDKHVRSFTEQDFILAKNDKGRVVAIYPGYRLPEDSERPFVLEEEEQEKGKFKFVVRNVSDMQICPSQAIGGVYSLPGALVAESGSKKILLLPLAEVLERAIDENKKEEYKQLKQVQKIPIIDDVPAPQARMHKLLMAYYLMLARNYNSARELLNPSSSFHQNEPFNYEEMMILSWIMDIKSDAPEVTALKLVALIHFKINELKFPLNYQNVSVELKKVILAIQDAQIAKIGAFNHLLSLREFSEKYYIYRIFPEVLREPLFKQIFGNVSKIMGKINISAAPAGGWTVAFIKNYANYSFGEKMESESFSYFYRTFVENLPKTEEAEVLKRLMHKGDSNTNYSTSLEMLIYCLLSEPKKFEVLQPEFNDFNENMNYDKFKFNWNLNNLKNYCHRQYWEKFQPVNQSVSMRTTDLDTLKTTMTDDLRRIALDFSSKSSNKMNLKLLDEEKDVKVILAFKVAIENAIKSEGAGIMKQVTFNEKAYDRSKVLKNLKASIENFIREKGENRTSRINLSEKSIFLEDLTRFLNKKLAEYKKDQNNDLSYLVEITNNRIHADAINSIINLMHRKKTKTFENLYACYLQNDSLACIQRKFPELGLKACFDVRDKAFLFYSRQILIDFYTMLTKSIKDLSMTNGSASIEDLTIFCDELAKVEKFNDRIKDPVVMNFEYRSRKYRLRAEQVDDIDKLIEDDPKTKLFKSIVIQRMMAAGKTLVLGTISVVKKAMNQSRLSILVPPSSLYQSNTTAMQTRTYQYFKKKGRNFSFPRFNLPKGPNAELVKNYLGTVIDLMEDSMKTQTYLILSPDTLHSYLNSYIEVLLNAEQNWNEKDYKEILRLYSTIYRIFKERGSIILDEIDMTMDPRKELNFPTQESEPYNMIAAALLADIMEFLVFEEKVLNHGLDIHSNNQASLTPENYVECRNLVLMYIEEQLKDKTSIWNKFILHGEENETLQKQIMAFLRHSDMSGEKEWIGKFYNGNEIIANSLIIVKSQLYQYMEDSLKGTVNENFGTAGNLRPEIKYAVPYVAANTPSPASVFADRWETLLKTLLMVSASPCSLEIAKEIIEHSKRSMSNESAGTEPLESTSTYKNLKLILPPDMDPILLDETKALHIEIVQKALSPRSPAAIRVLYSYYMNQVFSKMTFPTEQITSNALHMTSMFDSVQGYSGTIDNVNILPQSVIVDAHADHENNEKNNGGISLKLVNDCGDGTVVVLANDSFKKKVDKMVEDMFKLYNNDIINNVSAIIDTGAFFKNFKNRQVAEAVLKLRKGKFEVGLYYDEDSNQLEFVKKSGNSFTRGFLETTDPDDITRVTQADISKRFTFYDQRHITGSDILQPKTAHAIMTAGPRVLLRDILQGVLRMRQFMTSQKVHLVTTSASLDFYHSKVEGVAGTAIKVSDILALGALNEDDKQAHENEKLAFAKIGVEVRGFVLDEISRILTEKNPEKDDVVDLFNCARGIFLRLINEYPLDWLHNRDLKDSSRVLKEYALTLLEPLYKWTFGKDLGILQRFNSLKGRIKHMIEPTQKDHHDCLLHYVGDKINTRIHSENGNEVQMQTLTLTLIDLNMDQLIDQIDGNVTAKDHTYDLLFVLDNEKDHPVLENENDQFVNLKTLYNYPNRSASHTPLLNAALITEGERVGVTRDLIELIEVDPSGNRFPIFSKYTLEGSHLLVQIFDKSNLKVLLISSKHASEIQKILNPVAPLPAGHRMPIVWLCDLSGTVTATYNSGSEPGQNILKILPQSSHFIFDALVFNGSLPQILMNPILKNIYENEWLKADNFKDRAVFLLLRMKILLEKDSIMFEDDDLDLSNLKKYAMGDRNPGSKGNTTESYPKPPIDSSFHSSMEYRFKTKLIIEEEDPSDQWGKNAFDLNAEMDKLFKIVSNQVEDVTYKGDYKLPSDSTVEDKNGDISAEKSYDISKETEIKLGIAAAFTTKSTSASSASAASTSSSSASATSTSTSSATASGDPSSIVEIDFDELIKEYEKPILKSFADNSSKKIYINGKLLNDEADSADPQIKIDKLVMIEVDSKENPGTDEIDDEYKPPSSNSFTGGGGYGGGGGGGDEVDNSTVTNENADGGGGGEEEEENGGGDDKNLLNLSFGDDDKEKEKKKIVSNIVPSTPGTSTPTKPSTTTTTNVTSSSVSSSSSSSSSSTESSLSSYFIAIAAGLIILVIGSGFVIYRKKNLKLNEIRVSGDVKSEEITDPN